MKYIKYLFVTSIIAIAFTACKKEGDLLPVEEDASVINLINAGTDTVNFFQNGTRLNNTSFYYPGGTLGYLPVTSGEQSFQLKRAGTPTVLFDSKYTLEPARAYSMFITGTSADRIFITRDTLPNTDTLARVRFINASPDVAYDVKIGTSFTYTNRVFKSVTGFRRLLVGKYVLNVYEAGVTTPLITRTLDLAAKKNYTVYTRGKNGVVGTGAFAVVLLTY